MIHDAGSSYPNRRGTARAVRVSAAPTIHAPAPTRGATAKVNPTKATVDDTIIGRCIAKAAGHTTAPQQAATQTHQAPRKMLSLRSTWNAKGAIFDDVATLDTAAITLGPRVARCNGVPWSRLGTVCSPRTPITTPIPSTAIETS